jgi:hypothetical protein
MMDEIIPTALGIVLGTALGVLITVHLAHKDAEDGTLKTPWAEFQCERKGHPQ